MASLTMSINNTKMDVIDMLAQMWKSLNSTRKGQQDNTLWAALNKTKVDLQQKVRRTVTLSQGLARQNQQVS